MRLYHALAILDDWGGEWKRAASIRCEIYNASLRIASVLGADVEESDYRSTSDYVPQVMEGVAPKVGSVAGRQSAAEQMQVLRNGLGV